MRWQARWFERLHDTVLYARFVKKNCMAAVLWQGGTQSSLPPHRSPRDREKATPHRKSTTLCGLQVCGDVLEGTAWHPADQRELFLAPLPSSEAQRAAAAKTSSAPGGEWSWSADELDDNDNDTQDLEVILGKCDVLWTGSSPPPSATRLAACEFFYDRCLMFSCVSCCDMPANLTVQRV